MIIRVLLTSVVVDQKHADVTRDCYLSLQSNHTLDVMVDTRIHNNALAEKWNAFFDWWRWKDYDYLLIIANDTLARNESIDYMVQLMEETNVDLLNTNICRDFNAFQEQELKFKRDLVEQGGTSNFMLRRNVIEKVGRVDEYFPHEYIERDYFRRIELAGFVNRCTPMELFYHPSTSFSQINRTGVSEAQRRFIEKWGADWPDTFEKWEKPFNNPKLDFTYCIK